MDMHLRARGQIVTRRNDPFTKSLVLRVKHFWALCIQKMCNIVPFIQTFPWCQCQAKPVLIPSNVACRGDDIAIDRVGTGGFDAFSRSPSGNVIQDRPGDEVACRWEKCVFRYVRAHLLWAVLRDMIHQREVIYS